MVVDAADLDAEEEREVALAVEMSLVERPTAEDSDYKTPSPQVASVPSDAVVMRRGGGRDAKVCTPKRIDFAASPARRRATRKGKSVVYS